MLGRERDGQGGREVAADAIDAGLLHEGRDDGDLVGEGDEGKDVAGEGSCVPPVARGAGWRR